MLASKLNPAPEGRAEFEYFALRKVPEESGCYALSTFDETVLYIGQSVNICKRMEQHLDGGEKNAKTPWGVAFWLHYKLCPRNELDSTERGWMNEYKLKEGRRPFFNKVDPPV